MVLFASVALDPQPARSVVAERLARRETHCNTHRHCGPSARPSAGHTGRPGPCFSAPGSTNRSRGSWAPGGCTHTGRRCPRRRRRTTGGCSRRGPR